MESKVSLDSALAMIKLGGFYVMDDILAQPYWPEGHADKVTVLNERLIANPRMTGLVIEVRKQ